MVAVGGERSVTVLNLEEQPRTTAIDVGLGPVYAIDFNPGRRSSP